jgi:hypothetical protein
MFERPRHNAIAQALHASDAKLLAKARCYFGAHRCHDAVVLNRDVVDLSMMIVRWGPTKSFRRATRTSNPDTVSTLAVIRVADFS